MPRDLAQDALRYQWLREVLADARWNALPDGLRDAQPRDTWGDAEETYVSVASLDALIDDALRETPTISLDAYRNYAPDVAHEEAA